MAREVGDFNVTVNSVAPGLISNDSSKIMIPSAEFDRHTSTLCIKRYKQPEDLVGAVLFISSEQSDFITGQALVVDGGWVFH
jgi:NAD(P)-dependent dehydrogenase (short-subunit alcohol dehydrogenase family)